MTQDQFNALIFPEPNTGCFLWAGRHDNKGYGRLSHGAMHQVAHRQSYENAKGPFDKKMHVLHTCDNPACVNPDHLYLGDQRQNNIDRDSRGRQKTQHGTNHKLAKLDDEKVREIKRLHNPKTFPTRKLAKMFGVSQKIIMNVINNRSWTHVLPL